MDSKTDLPAFPGAELISLSTDVLKRRSEPPQIIVATLSALMRGAKDGEPPSEWLEAASSEQGFDDLKALREQLGLLRARRGIARERTADGEWIDRVVTFEDGGRWVRVGTEDGSQPAISSEQAWSELYSGCRAAVLADCDSLETSAQAALAKLRADWAEMREGIRRERETEQVNGRAELERLCLWPVAPAIYWAACQEVRWFANPHLIETARQMCGDIDGAALLWSRVRAGALAVLGRERGEGKLMPIPLIELQVGAKMVTPEHNSPSEPWPDCEAAIVITSSAALFWTDIHFERSGLMDVFPPAGVAIIDAVGERLALPASTPATDRELSELVKAAEDWIAKQPPEGRLVWTELAAHLSVGRRPIGPLYRKHRWGRLQKILKARHPTRWAEYGRAKKIAQE